MKKNLLKITFASLLALSLGACGGGGNGGGSGSTSTSGNPGPTSSVPPHVHQYDEHGVCPADGAYRGDTKDATQEDPYVLKNIVAGTEYYFRLKAAKNIQTVLTCNDNPKADATRTKLWETDGTVWNEISINSMTHIISNISDGYYYVRYVSTENIAQINWFVQNHVHQAINEQGFCWCDEYMGSNLNINQELTINPTVANTTYYARVRGLNPAERYQLDFDSTALDLSAVYGAWGTDNHTTFTAVDVFEPTGAIGYKNVYLAFKPSISNYSATFRLVTAHRPDDCGYCITCGEFVGEDLNYSVLLDLYSIDEGIRYFRIPDISKDDLVMFTTGWSLNSDDEVTFYSRSADGETITELPYRPEVAFLAPELPDGYLYVKIIADCDRLAPFFGLNDMGSGYGQNGDIFTGVTMNDGNNAVVELGTNEALFFKFYVYEEHLYQLANRGGYDSEDFTWIGHDKENDTFIEKGHPTQITLDEDCKLDGVLYDYFIIRLMPATARGETMIRFNVTHRYDSMQVCVDDGYFGGIEVSFDQAVVYDHEDEVGYYRFPVREDAEYTFSYSDGAALSHFEFFKYESGYVSVGWAGEATPLESEDGYIYIKIDADHAHYAGQFTVSETIN